MELHEAIYTYLSAHAGLYALVGDGIFPDVIDQEWEQSAAVVYQMIGGDVDDHLTGAGLDAPIYQFAAYANSNKSAWAVYKQLQAALRNYTGAMGELTLQRVKQMGLPIKDYEPDTGRHSYKVDFQFYTE